MLIVKKSAAKVHILYYNEECGGRVVKRNAEFLRFFIIWGLAGFNFSYLQFFKEIDGELE